MVSSTPEVLPNIYYCSPNNLSGLHPVVSCVRPRSSLSLWSYCDTSLLFLAGGYQQAKYLCGGSAVPRRRLRRIPAARQVWEHGVLGDGCCVQAEGPAAMLLKCSRCSGWAVWNWSVLFPAPRRLSECSFLSPEAPNSILPLVCCGSLLRCKNVDLINFLCRCKPSSIETVFKNTTTNSLLQHSSLSWQLPLSTRLMLAGFLHPYLVESAWKYAENEICSIETISLSTLPRRLQLKFFNWVILWHFFGGCGTSRTSAGGWDVSVSQAY